MAERACVQGLEMIGSGRELGVLSLGFIAPIEGVYRTPPRELAQVVEGTPIVVAPMPEGPLVDIVPLPLVDIPPLPTLNDLNIGGCGQASKPPLDLLDDMEVPRVINIWPRNLSVGH